MKWLIIVLYVLSVALPLSRAASLFLRASKISEDMQAAPEAEVGGVSWAQVTTSSTISVAEQKNLKKSAGWDMIIVGVGLAAGAVGGIMSLYFE